MADRSQTKRPNHMQRGVPQGHGRPAGHQKPQRFTRERRERRQPAQHADDQEQAPELLLRVHGDRTPSVEVLPAGLEPTAYHQAAIVGSRSVWARSGTETESATPAPSGAS